MPEQEQQQTQTMGFGDVVVENLARQLAQKSVEVAMAEARIVQIRAEFEQKIDEMAKTIAELQEEHSQLTKEFPAPEPEGAPSASTKPEHNGRTTEKKEKVKADG